MDLPSALQTFRSFTDQVKIFSDDDWHRLASQFALYEGGRKVNITQAGEAERYLYFVVGGVQRVFYFDDQNREATLVFTYAPSFGGVIDSMVLGGLSKYSYETLTPSLFLRAPYRQIEMLRKEMPALDEMMQMGVMSALSGILERLAEIQCFSSEEKFRSLMGRSPHLLNLVPHKYLANYLGIDPTNFSKLVNRIRF